MALALVAPVAPVMGEARGDQLPVRGAIDRSAVLSQVSLPDAGTDASAVSDGGDGAAADVGDGSASAAGDGHATEGVASGDSGCSCLVVTPNGHGGRSYAVALVALLRKRRDRRVRS